MHLHFKNLPSITLEQWEKALEDESLEALVTLQKGLSKELCRMKKELKDAFKKEKLETLKIFQILLRSIAREVKRKELERRKKKVRLRRAAKHGYLVAKKTVEVGATSFNKMSGLATPLEEIGEMYKWTIGGSEMDLRFLRLFSKHFGLEADKKYLEL